MASNILSGERANLDPEIAGVVLYVAANWHLFAKDYEFLYSGAVAPEPEDRKRSAEEARLEDV